jgi:D-alanyl-D-alanine carboxypeptidase
VSTDSGQEPADVSHRYCVGSITKTFVAVVVMQLVGEGLLDLDKNALQYLEGGNKDLVSNIYNTEKASLLQLLNHQSGIPTWYDLVMVPC